MYTQANILTLSPGKKLNLNGNKENARHTNSWNKCIDTKNPWAEAVHVTLKGFNVHVFFLSILGFRVVCATCGRQIQHPEFRLARSK